MSMVPGHGEGQLLPEGKPTEVTPAQHTIPLAIGHGGAELGESAEEAGQGLWGLVVPSWP